MRETALEYKVKKGEKSIIDACADGVPIDAIQVPNAGVPDAIGLFRPYEHERRLSGGGGGGRF